MKENVLIVAALSGMGRAIAGELARRGHSLVLAARDEEELARTAADLRVRHHATVETVPFEALDFNSHPALVDAADLAFPGGLTGVVFCAGWMASQELAAADFHVAKKMIDVNYTSAVSLLNHAANLFERRRRGWICALSSVAGDRGRQSNYLYGATKSALTAYLQGLRNRLTPARVAVITVKPGCVDTPMTYGGDKLPFLVAPEVVARDVARAILRRDSVVYTPRIWRPIMTALCLVPEALFRRMRL
ncbi:MAG TPA: SDR family NAD(P)-dependent oxidoreductase [Pirellulales bacterium]|nr:SDR family NAD(P)-dependent oxidoreductase [Pirellulales bacterium]